MSSETRMSVHRNVAANGFFAMSVVRDHDSCSVDRWIGPVDNVFCTSFPSAASRAQSISPPHFTMTECALCAVGLSVSTSSVHSFSVACRKLSATFRSSPFGEIHASFFQSPYFASICHVRPDEALCVSAVQGHPRSLILAPIEKVCATSY